MANLGNYYEVNYDTRTTTATESMVLTPIRLILLAKNLPTEIDLVVNNKFP